MNRIVAEAQAELQRISKVDEAIAYERFKSEKALRPLF
jgi:hypothetical protein